MRLTGKTALVTGASRGIGAATAIRLAAEGAHVLVNYARSADAANRVAEQIAAEGGHALGVQADLSRPDGIATLFQQVDNVFGESLDILVNNAGVYEHATIDEADAAHLDRMLQVNVGAVFAVTAQATRRMSSGGRIITIGSCLGDRIPFPGGSAYAATKAAVQLLARGWARDLGPQGITVNTVQPGPIDTEMNPADAEKNSFADFQRKSTALGRYGQPAEVAAAVAFLASPDASYITGCVLNVDGGFGA